MRENLGIREFGRERENNITKLSEVRIRKINMG